MQKEGGNRMECRRAGVRVRREARRDNTEGEKGVEKEGGGRQAKEGEWKRRGKEEKPKKGSGIEREKGSEGEEEEGGGGAKYLKFLESALQYQLRTPISKAVLLWIQLQTAGRIVFEKLHYMTSSISLAFGHLENLKQPLVN